MLVGTAERELIAGAFGIKQEVVERDAVLIADWHGTGDALKARLRRREWPTPMTYRYLTTLRRVLVGYYEPAT